MRNSAPRPGRGDRSAQTQSRSGQAQADRGPSSGRGASRAPINARTLSVRTISARPGNAQTSFLGPIGLPPAQAQRMPWWEQRQIPCVGTEADAVVGTASRSPSVGASAGSGVASQRRAIHPIYRPGFGRPPVLSIPLPPYGYYFPFTTYGYGTCRR